MVPANLVGVQDANGRFLQGAFSDIWQDVHSRNTLPKELELDLKPGMLGGVVANSCPGGTGTVPTFGEEILAGARTL